MAEARYRVYHYLEIADNPWNYSLYEDEILIGTVWDWTEATISQNIVNAGYIPPPWVDQQILEEPDFTTHVDIYYNKYHRINYDLRWWTNDANNPSLYNSDSLPITLQPPTRTWFVFLWWEGSGIENPPQLNHTIGSWTEGDLGFTAWWTPSSYRVLYIFKRLGEPWYSLEETETLWGETWQYTDFQPKSFPWMTQVWTIEPKIIEPNGSTYVRVFYDRDICTITFDSDWGTPIESITAEYGASLTPPQNPTKPWDTFLWWLPNFPETMPGWWAHLVAQRASWQTQQSGRIMIGWQPISKRMINWKQVQRIMYDWNEIWPSRTSGGYLCFTANTAGSTVTLNKNGSPTEVELEISTDGNTWTTYNMGRAVVLSNVWDKVYRRNKSTVDTGFSSWFYQNFYRFSMTWSVAWSWNVTSLLNKNFTNTLSNYCFLSLFEWCNSLTSAPEMPIITCGVDCCNSMYASCTWLKIPPALPATTLADSCYADMFQGCTNLIEFPALPATTLANSCYIYMFNGCYLVKTAPEIPATTLGRDSCTGMFSGCTGLTSIPALPATTLTPYCYRWLFENCSNIKFSEVPTAECKTPYRIPCEWIWTMGWHSFDWIFNWTTWPFTGEPNINQVYYTNMDVVPTPVYPPTPVDDYLCFTANTANSTIALNIYNPHQQTPVSLEYSIDKSTWIDYTWNVDGDNFNWSIITLPSVWSKVYWRNKSETPVKFSTGTDHYYNFAMTWSIAASWDTGYLFCKDSTTSFPYSLSGCHFYRLFRDCAALTTPPKLPITYIDQSSYSGMFHWCYNLTIAPELPWTTVEPQGYVWMFHWCSSLITPPELLATDLWQDCYAGMFMNCTSLSSLPSLPCTSIPRWAYRYMFSWCSNIKLSETQTWIYQTAYRIPTNWTWSIGADSLLNMFEDTWWTFTGTPAIDTTYYTSNTIV